MSPVRKKLTSDEKREISNRQQRMYRRNLRNKREVVFEAFTKSSSSDVQTTKFSPTESPPTSDELVQKKAKERGDQTFTLVGQDLTSPKTIGFWIMENIETAPEMKLLNAVTIAVRMGKNFGRKNAD